VGAAVVSALALRTMAHQTATEGLKDADGYVYLIDAGMDVKIGYARNPFKRLALLQTGNSEPLRLAAAFPGTKQTERELHELFAGDRIRGEWFYPSYELVAYFQERM
jgi:hypothetical protein